MDVGCHLGSMLSLFSRRCPEGKRYAFEPTPQSAAWLRKKFPDADVREMALSDAPRRMTFHVSSDSPGHSSLGSSKAQGRTSDVEVEVSTLDDELLGVEKIGFLKLDVEGAERSVLRGGKRFFAEHQPVVQFECGRNICKPFGYGPGELHDAFTEELGYEVFSLQGALTRELPVLPRAVMEHMQTYPWAAFNFMALPAERAAAIRRG